MERVENHMVVDSLWPAGAKVVCQCAQCREDIYEGEDIYDIEGDVIHEDCLSDWAKMYREVAEKC